MERRPGDRQTLLAARLAIAFEGWFVLALLALHLLRPDLAPSRSMISQYAVGPWGALMASAFAAAALALASLVFGLLRVGPQALSARAAEVLFGIAVIGLLTSAVFPMDIRPPRTLSGRLHEISFMVNVSCSVVATLLLSVAFGSDGRWRPARASALAWFSAQALAFVLQVVTIGARSYWGLANRLFVLTAVGWFLAVVLRLREVARETALVTAHRRS